MKFLEYVSSDLFRKIEDVQKYTIVFPHHRAGLFLKQAISKKIVEEQYKRPVLLPSMLTLDELVVELSGMHIEDELLSVCRLYQLCRKHVKGWNMKLDVFYGWGRQLLSDFSNVEMIAYEGDLKQVFELSSAAAQLSSTPFDKEELKKFYDLMSASLEKLQNDCYIREEYLKLWSALPQIYVEFSSLQTGDRQGSRGAITRYVCEHFDDDVVQNKIRGKQFVFVGFNYLLGQERRLMRLIKDADCTSSWYWDDSSGFSANPRAFANMEINIKEFGQALEKNDQWKKELKWVKKSVTVASSASVAAQAQYVHDWLCNLYPQETVKIKVKDGTANFPIPQKENESQNETDERLRQEKDYKDELEKLLKSKGSTGIVIADESVLESVIYALPGYVSGYVNITKGYPMRETRVFADVMAHLNDPKLDSVSEALKSVSDLLSSDGEPESESDETSWRQNLKQESYYQMRLVINRMQSILEGELGELITDVKVLRCLMRRHLEAITMPFHGAPLQSIQVIGVLETRLLDFDNLLVLNCEEGTLPRTGHDTSFIPYYVRKAYGMQTNTEEADVFAYNFFRLLRRAGNTTLLFSDASGKKSMSRFLMQILTTPQDFKPVYALLTERDAVATDELNLMDSSGPATYFDRYQRDEMRREENRNAGSEDKKDWSRPLQISPSAINRYLNCPMQFYLKDVLCVREPEDEKRMLQSNEMGSIIHGALEKFYLKLTDHRQPAVITREMIEKMNTEDERNAAIDASYTEMNEKYRFRHSLSPKSPNKYVRADHPAEDIIIVDYVKRVLDRDQNELAPFRLLGMELNRYAELQITDPATGKQHNILTGGSIDRLDEVQKKPANPVFFRILDYKTGQYHEDKLRINKLDDLRKGGKDYVLQTLIYSLACSPDVGRNKYGKKDTELVNAHGLHVMPELYFLGNKNASSTLQIGGIPVCNFEMEEKSAFIDLLTEIVQEIVFQTDFKKCDESKCSVFCPYHQLCERKKKDYN